MLVQKIKQISDVNKFDVSVNQLAYTVQNELFIADLDGNTKLTFTDEEKHTVPPNIYDDGFCCLNISNDQSLLLINNEFQVFEFPITGGSLYSMADQTLFFRVDKYTENEHIAKMNLQKEVLWTVDSVKFVVMHATKEYLFYRGSIGATIGVTLTALNNQTGEMLWCYTLPDEFDSIFLDEHDRAQIVSILGVYNDVVWLSLNSGALVGLDAATGELVKHIVSIDYFDGAPFEEVYDRAFFNRESQLDTEQGIIFNCVSDRYVEVDLNQDNYPYSVWDIEAELAKQPYVLGGLPFDISNIAGWEGDTVYIYDRRHSHCFGAFDRKTKKVLWSEIFDAPDEGWGAIFAAKYSNNHLYVQSKVDRSLHIYQLIDK